jgi:hypothetical protein
MLVMGTPQFPTQDDFGIGLGMSPISQWQIAPMSPSFQNQPLEGLDLDPGIGNILARLRSIFHEPQFSVSTSTELHDLTCFVMHRLLLLPPISTSNPQQHAVSECLRYSMALYMLIIHGTTYYSHENLAHSLGLQLQGHLTTLAQAGYSHDRVGVWLLSVGMVATINTMENKWFRSQALAAALHLNLRTWNDVLVRLESILWTKAQHVEGLFQQAWKETLGAVAT